MLAVFKQANAVEQHVRDFIKAAQAPPSGPPPGMPPSGGPPGAGGPPQGPPPPPWADPMQPPGQPKVPPSARKTPDQLPYDERARLQGEVFGMDPTAVNEGLRFLGKGSHPKELLQAHGLGLKERLTGRTNGHVKVALGVRLARQLLRDGLYSKWLPDPRIGKSQKDSLAQAFVESPEEMDKDQDSSARYTAKRKVRAAVEKSDK